MKVPFIDFTGQNQEIKKEVDAGFKAVIKHGDFVLGKEEQDFEKSFAKYCEAKYAVGVNSGTDALYLAVCAFNIGVGDEVILPTFTYIATALCISYTGAKAVFVDIEKDTYNIDPIKLEKAITPQTKAVIPVHIYGQAANMAEIKVIAIKHNLKVIEDAAQAHGARYQGKRIGSLGDAACFSFYPTKGLGAYGDGGMVVTDDEKVYKECLMLRDYGRESRYVHKVKGYNSRLDTLQAVVLSAKLKRLDQWNKMRAQVAAHYNKLLKDVDGVVTPKLTSDRTHVYQTYAVRIKRHRQKVHDALLKKGVSVLIHYPIPIHLQEAYQELNHKTGDFPEGEAIADETLSLPMFPHMSKKQVEYVCQSLKDILKNV